MSKKDQGYAAHLARRARGLLFMALACVCLAMPALALAQQLTGTFLGRIAGREVAFRHQGKARNNWAGVLKFKIDDGPEVGVFCIQIDVHVRPGDRYRSDGPVLSLQNGCQIRYLLDKYPASTTNDPDEAAARQMAIWVFSDGVDPTTIEDSKVRERTVALVNEARMGKCPARRTEAPDLTLEPPNTNLAAGKTVAYTVRVGPQDAGQNVTVSVNGPALLTDASGAGSAQQQLVPLNAQGLGSFWVTGTGAGQSTVSVALPFRLEAGTVFNHLDDGAPTQRLVLAESQTLLASAAAQISWSAAAAAPPPPTAVPTEQAPPPPTPTRRPSRPPRPTATPEQPGQPTVTVVLGEEATAAASPTPAENIPAGPGAPLGPGGEATPAPQPTGNQPAGAAPAGGAAQPRPRSLPNTGAPNSGAGWSLLVGVALLVIGAWLARQRRSQ